MEPIQVVGDVGASLDATSIFSVISVETLAKFTKVIITATLLNARDVHAVIIGFAYRRVI